MKQGGVRNLLLGQAGTYRVLAELLRRDVNAFLPVVDTGVDILTVRGVRIQVKATRLARRNTRSGYNQGPAYFFTPGVKTRRGGKTLEYREYYVRRFSDEVDYVVLWGSDQDRFWIVPATVLDSLKCLQLDPGRQQAIVGSSRIALVYQHEGRWDLLGAAPTIIDAAEPLKLVAATE